MSEEKQMKYVYSRHSQTGKLRYLGVFEKDDAIDRYFVFEGEGSSIPIMFSTILDRDEHLKLEKAEREGIELDEKPFNKLRPDQVEKLAILIEEASEVIKAAGKILRHGYQNGKYDNRKDLEDEIQDLHGALLLFSIDELKTRSQLEPEARYRHTHHQGLSR